MQLSLAQREDALRQQLALERSRAEAEANSRPFGRQPGQVDPGFEGPRDREVEGRQRRQFGSERGECRGLDRAEIEAEIEHSVDGGITVGGVQLGCTRADGDAHRQVTDEPLRSALDRGVDAIGMPTSSGSLVVKDERGVANDYPPHKLERRPRFLENLRRQIRQIRILVAKTKGDLAVAVADETQHWPLDDDPCRRQAAAQQRIEAEAGGRLGESGDQLAV